MVQPSRPKLVLAVTTTHALVYLRGQVRAMVERGFDVTVLAPEDPGGSAQVSGEGGTMVPIPFLRDPSPFRDLECLVRTLRVLRSVRPDVVNAGTPKAGFVVLLAAVLSRVPARIYTLRGLRFSGETGVRRHLFRGLEWLTSACAHVVICISPSLRAEAIDEGVAAPEKMVVLGAGSSNGVALDHYSPSPKLAEEGARLRAQYGIPAQAPIVLFVGRLARDKGIGELAEAWQAIGSAFPGAYLVLAGESEQRELWPQVARDVLQNGPRIILLGRVGDPAPWYDAATVVALPSWREGFGNVLTEGSAMQRPVVATDVTGCRDAVLDGITGRLVPPRDAGALAAAVMAYLADPTMAQVHGSAGRARVVKEFDSQVIWRAQAELYRRLATRRIRDR